MSDQTMTEHDEKLVEVPMTEEEVRALMQGQPTTITSDTLWSGQSLPAEGEHAVCGECDGHGGRGVVGVRSPCFPCGGLGYVKVSHAPQPFYAITDG